MDNINEVVGRNIKQIRDEKGLSLDKVSKLTDVSKSMLGQIERGESSPSINVLWKIAHGLKVNFQALVHESKEEYDKVQVQKAVTHDNGNYRLFPVFSFDQDRNFEMYRVEIESQGYLEADPHPKGVEEYITVFDGTLTIQLGDQYIDVGKGESIRFHADQKHKYSNETLIKTEYALIIYYSK